MIVVERAAGPGGSFQCTDFSVPSICWKGCGNAIALVARYRDPELRMPQRRRVASSYRC